jgi:hypothetical protein
MSVTLDVSQFVISESKLDDAWNIYDISVRLDVSHFEMSDPKLDE